nr:MAG TPA: helix-turn-helix domain protein [Caudoviricetes sp.]
MRVNPERKEHVNVKLKAIREESGKTQAQIANEAQISCRAYCYYEQGTKEPKVRTAIRIARALNSSVEALFPETGKEASG